MSEGDLRKKSLNFGINSANCNVLLVVMLLIVVSLLGISGSAADEGTVEQYAPILYFEGAETCFPVNVSYHIDNSYLYQFTENATILLDETPTSEKLYNYSDNEYVYLDNQYGSPDDDNIISDYQSKMSSLGYTVYSRVHTSGEMKIIQYWMFYAFNNGELNQHEGDWEMVQVVISDGTPTKVMYSQHHGGQQATWEQVEKEGDHIKVYVARGSHANYLRSYSGKFGIASDYVGDDGKVIQPTDYTVMPLDSQGWLGFAGRWGEVNSIEDSFLGKIGSQGPMYREDGTMWSDPFMWGSSLPLANDNVFLLEWFLYNFVIIFILLTVISLCIIAFRIYRRHKKYGLGPRIVSMFYIDGFNIKSIGNIICIVGIIIAIFGLFHTWYEISVGINAGDFGTEGMTDLISINGINGVQISFPGSGGPIPIGSLVIPFSAIIGIGLFLMVLTTIGISTSKKLGHKYIWRGIKLLSPIIMILIAIMAIGLVIPSFIAGDAGEATIENVFDSISGSPLGGTETITVSESGTSGQIDMQWGLGLGGQLLIVAGIVLLVAGIVEVIAKTSFFEEGQFEKPGEGPKNSKRRPKEKIEENESPKLEESEKIKKQ